MGIAGREQEREEEEEEEREDEEAEDCSGEGGESVPLLVLFPIIEAGALLPRTGRLAFPAGRGEVPIKALANWDDKEAEARGDRGSWVSKIVS